MRYSGGIGLEVCIVETVLRWGLAGAPDSLVAPRFKTCKRFSSNIKSSERGKEREEEEGKEGGEGRAFPPDL